MAKRMQILLVLVGVLLFANIIYWTKNDRAGEKPGRSSDQTAFRAEDFYVAVGDRSGDRKATRRDLFYVARPPRKPKPVIRKVVTPAKPVVKVKTPEELQREKVERELGNIYLVGVLQRQGRLQAYVQMGDQTFLVRSGEELTGGYQVQQLSLSEMVIAHKQTGITKTIEVSGN